MGVAHFAAGVLKYSIISSSLCGFFSLLEARGSRPQWRRQTTFSNCATMAVVARGSGVRSGVAAPGAGGLEPCSGTQVSADLLGGRHNGGDNIGEGSGGQCSAGGGGHADADGAGSQSAGAYFDNDGAEVATGDAATLVVEAAAGNGRGADGVN